MTKRNIVLPSIREVVIRHFSLFPARDEIRVNFTKPGFCLAGANGLGKSTFLSCIVYGLTGILRDPRRRSFLSFGEFAKVHEKFASQYFDGRIEGADRELAHIEISFCLANAFFKVRRTFFAGSEVESWSVEPEVPLFSRDTRGYEEAIAHWSGMTFDQFNFFVHNVLFFDESRPLLFWDSTTLSRMLSLVFGWDSDIPAKLDSLIRQAEKADSRVRNIQWDITKTRTFINQLRKNTSTNVDEADEASWEARERYKRLQIDSEALRSQAEDKERQLDRLRIRLSETAAKRLALRSQYDRVYNQLLMPKGIESLRFHPVLRSALETGQCSVCSTSGSHITESISIQLERNECPLCQTELEHGDEQTDEQLTRTLHELAQELAAIDEVDQEQHRELDRLQRELENDANTLDNLQAEMLDLENSAAFARAGLGSVDQRSIQTMIQANHSRISSLLQDKQKAEQDREQAVEAVEEIHRKLEDEWREAESRFIPIFRSLAQEFIGLPVRINLVPSASRKKPELKFVLEVQDSLRQQEHQLSESQRFFIDIALRMAIVGFCQTEETGTGGLLIDTPEGALDAAYEANAGEMFAKFIESGGQIIMTANINSSGLLRTLAKRTGHEKFQLQRMLDWVHLSDVQLDRRDLFDEALNVIESYLSGDNK